MKKPLLLLMAMASILAISVLSGCIETESETVVEDEKIESMIWNFTDPLGGKVVLGSEPERIVTMTPALTEIMNAVGAWEKVVGCDSSSDLPPEAKELEHVVSWQGLDAEKLVLLKPDLVIMDRTLDITDMIYTEIKELDIPVYRIYPKNISDVLNAIRAVGELTNETVNATAVIDDFVERMNAVSQAANEIAEEDIPSVLHVTYYDGTADPWIATDSTFSGSLIIIAGGECAISDSSGYGVQMSLESIIESNPDIIFCSQSSSWPTLTRETILGDARWSDINAISSDSVFDVAGDWCDRTGPRMILGLEEFHGHIMDHVEA